jgi:hypothetical protein
MPLPDAATTDAAQVALSDPDLPDDLHIDGCACDVQGRTDADDTDDVELPPAQGGVAG